ncbi:MAG TPA: carboxypeptidase M32 [Candidatus Saccharimonadales bacterium]|nr:carboxypeptidase M32 [Candidatus Saccharimonadales bacterium]
MSIKNATIEKLLKKYHEISQLNHISAILNWDLNVNLPSKAGKDRSEQLGYLTQLITDKWHDTEFRKIVEDAQKQKNLTHEEQAIVRNITYATKYYYNVPKELIIKKEKVTSEAFPIWNQAREENEFKKFEPYLTEIVEINQEIATHLTYKTNPYDALLDRYEPELTAAECQRLFDGLKKELVPLIKKITSSKNYTDSAPFVNGTQHYSHADQEKIVEYVSHKMGFDFTSGRIDTAPHPFTTTLGSSDVRLTTHYNVRNFQESFTATMHETGHGLYEQRINPKYALTPLEGGVSLGIHEALSRFWENIIGKNPHFIRSITPLFQTLYFKQLGQIKDDTLIKAFNIVKPSLIRIHADEVSYSLHIILRFEIENELMNGKLKVKDAPDAWREKSHKLFGITPETDKEGILQDVHWTYGEIGYFPSYAMGNIYGAQFLNKMQKDIDVDETLGKGNLIPVKDWLDDHIHTHGSLYFPKELLKRVTGEELDHTHFIKYLTKKYSKIYDL